MFTNFCLAQSEARKNFVITLNVPDNERNSNNSFKNFAKDNNLKKLTCYRGNEITTELFFDKNGNVVKNIDTSNKVIGSSEFEYDKKDRLVKISYFEPNGNFKYGYKYKYSEPYRYEFDLGDTIPKKREIHLKEENIKIYSDYDLEKGWELSTVIFSNKNGDYERELRYNKNGIYSEYKYYYNQSERKNGTFAISYDENGMKTSEKLRSVYETDANGNTIKKYSAYSTGNLELISTHKYNEQNQILENDYPNSVEIFDYDQNGKIQVKTIEDRNGITKLGFHYQNSLPEKIVKVNGQTELIFRYEYQYYE